MSKIIFSLEYSDLVCFKFSLSLLPTQFFWGVNFLFVRGFSFLVAYFRTKKVLNICNILFEPPYDKTNKMTVAPSEVSDQPGHQPRQIRDFAYAQWVAKVPMLLHADCEDSDQIGRMLRLI